MADSASPCDRFIGSCPNAGKANTPATGENAPCRSLRRRAWGVAWKLHRARLGGVSVNRPSWRTGGGPPASRTARFRTTCRSKSGR